MNKLFTCLFAGYICYAITVASSSSLVSTQGVSHGMVAKSPLVAKVSQYDPFGDEQLDNTNPRADYSLTIWSLSEGCTPCERLKTQVVSLEAAGYTVEVKYPPAPQWVTSFPSTAVREGDETVGWIKGYFTLAILDEKLGIKEDEDEDEDDNGTEEIPDYDIGRP